MKKATTTIACLLVLNASLIGSKAFLFSKPDTGEEYSRCGKLCNIKGFFCPFSWKLLCGSDGKTYMNKCHLDLTNCARSDDEDCVTVDYEGRCCEYEPCVEVYDPVCGSDGVTYENDCELSIADCKSHKTGGVDIERLHGGECRDCDDIRCTADWNPVCGSDGKTYSNACELGRADCKNQQKTDGERITAAYEGDCCDRDSACAEPNDHSGSVCGTDGNIYITQCLLQIADCTSKSSGGDEIKFAYRGRCWSCEDVCPTEFDAVCGSDFITYENRCAMKKADCRSQESNGPPITESPMEHCERCGLLKAPAVHDPVCGSDGKTYGNTHHLANENCKRDVRGEEPITVIHTGAC